MDLGFFPQEILRCRCGETFPSRGGRDALRDDHWADEGVETSSTTTAFHAELALASNMVTQNDRGPDDLPFDGNLSEYGAGSKEQPV